MASKQSFDGLSPGNRASKPAVDDFHAALSLLDDPELGGVCAFNPFLRCSVI